MNREILFRGKGNPKYNDGDWYYGYLIFDGEDYQIVEPKCGSFRRTVLKETVGEFTGMTDKNGKRIFEGDIVQYYGTYPLEVYIEKGHTKIRWYDTISASTYDELFFSIDREGYGECEIIGNIHDNPELLKGGEE